MAIFKNTVRDPNFSTSITSAGIADGDSIILQEGADQYSAGMNLASITLASLIATAECRCNIVAGSPLIIDVASGGAGHEKIEWSGGTWYRSAGADAAITLLTWSPSGGGLGQYSGFTVTTAFVTRGTLVIADDSDANTVEQVGGVLNLTKSAQTGTSYRGTDGICKMNRQFASVYVNGSEVTYGLGVTGPGTRLEVTSGRLTYMGGDIGGGLYLYGGVVDFSKLPASITITGGVEWENSTIINPPPGVVVTWSPTVRGKGAKRV